jgi:hypothetical protein
VRAAAEVTHSEVEGSASGRTRMAGRLTPLLTARSRPLALQLAAGLSIACGLIHFAVAQGHLDHSWVFAGMLLLAGAGQTAFGFALLARPSQPLIVAGIAMTAAIIGAYVVTRTWGVPFEEIVAITPTDSIAITGDPEPVGPLDMETPVSELVLVAALATQLRGAWRRWALNGLLIAGIALWVLRLTGVLEAPLP